MPYLELPDCKLHYKIDDHTDPWTRPDTVLFVDDLARVIRHVAGGPVHVVGGKSDGISAPIRRAGADRCSKAGRRRLPTPSW